MADAPLAARRRTGQRPWLRPPRLRTLDAAKGEERHASWLELFFDLVFVVAIAQLADQLVQDHSLRGFGIFVGLYLPVFIAWQGFSFYADRFDTDDVLFRGVMLAAMLAIAALAIQIPDVAHGRHTTGFVVAYVTLRSLLVGLYLRTWRSASEGRPLFRRYIGGYSVSIAIWLASLLVSTPTRYWFWAVGLAIEYAMPPLALRIHSRIPTDTSHVPERFALFTIIVLGESVVAIAIGTADSDWQVASAFTAVLGFLLVVCLWWVYFDMGIAGGLSSSTLAILKFAYVHIPLLGALTAVGAGVHLLIVEVADHHDHASAGTAWALNGGATLFLLCLWVAQHTTTRGVIKGVGTARIAVATVLVALAAAAGTLPPVVFVAVSAAALVGLVAFEIHSGLAGEEPWRAPVGSGADVGSPWAGEL
jgi:low temperature requirement protein LtrA